MLNNSLYFGIFTLLLGTGLQLTGLVNKPWGWTCFVAAAAMLALSLFVSVFRWCQLPNRARFSLTNLRYLRWSGRIALRDAAQIIYTEARAQDSMWADAAERMSLDKSPDGILCYVAEIIKQDTAFYGKRLPSTHVETLDPLQSQYGTVTEGARELRMRDNTQTVFVDLAIDTKDLRRALQEVRSNLKTTTQI